MKKFSEPNQIKEEIIRIQEDKKYRKKGFLIFGIIQIFLHLFLLLLMGIEVYFSEIVYPGMFLGYAILPIAFAVYQNSNFRRKLRVEILEKHLIKIETEAEIQAEIRKKVNSKMDIFINLYEEKIEEKLKAFNTYYPENLITLELINGLELTLWKDEYSIFFIITNNTAFKNGFLRNIEELNVDEYKTQIEGIFKSLNYIKFDDLQYYTVEGEKTSKAIVSGGGGEGGGVSFTGAAIGGLLLGPVGMIIGSRKKTEIGGIQTNYIEDDSRVLNLYYKNGNQVEKIEFSHKEYSKLRGFLPDFDLAVVNQRLALGQLNTTENLLYDDAKVPKQIDIKSVDKITRLKELTSMREAGFIDETEFKKLKKEIIG